MEPNPATRRRSPGWIRAYSSPALHGLALRLMKMGTTTDLSESQEWLWRAVISELEYRWRTTSGLQRCSCMLCVPPFPEE